MAGQTMTPAATDDDFGVDADEQEDITLNSEEISTGGSMAARRLLEIRREERELNSYLDDMFDY